MIIECPSGLVLENRKIKVRELEALAEATEDDVSDGGIIAIMRGTFQRVVDSGPYPFAPVGDAQPDWSRILMGDIVTMLFTLREKTVGDEYEFPVKCEECRKLQPCVIEVSKIPVRKLPADSRAKLAAGEHFEAKTLDGALLKFHLQNAKQQEPIARLLRQEARNAGKASKSLVDTYAGQVFYIEALAEKSRDHKARLNWFRDLDLDELDHIKEQLEAADCGIDTEVHSKCIRCGWVTDVIIPLRGGFFRRRKRQVEEEAMTLDLEEEATGS